MTILVAIATWSMFAFGVLLMLVQLILYEVGFRIGRSQAKHGQGQSEGVGVVLGSMLGLMAFVLALTLSFANGRFTERRAGTLAEANAIGTAWLRAKAIGHPRGEEIARLLEEYTQLRMDYVRAGRGRDALTAVNLRTSAMQSLIWGHLLPIVRDQPNPVSASLMGSLNEAFDAATAERFAYELRLPPQIIWLLLGMTLLSVTVIGYQLGLRARPVRALVAVLAAMWSLVIVDIIDLASARIGSLRIDVSAYEWTLQGFKSGVAIPPLPDR